MMRIISVVLAQTGSLRLITHSYPILTIIMVDAGYTKTLSLTAVTILGMPYNGAYTLIYLFPDIENDSIDLKT